MYGHLLTEIGVHKCYTLIDWHVYSSLTSCQRSVFSFHSRYLFPYFIIALLAEGKNLSKESFFDKYQYQSGFNDIPLLFDMRSIYFNSLIPYFKKIVQNPNAIELLSLILQRSNIEQPTREQIKNREILSCRSDNETCKTFVLNTLHKFVANS